MKEQKRSVNSGLRTSKRKRFAAFAIVTVAVVLAAFVLSQTLLRSPEDKFSFEAAIVDQIGSAPPSDIERAKQFNENATSILRKAGFNVSYFESQHVTVNFFKKLATRGWGVIVLRAHSALREGGGAVDIFTSEEFREDRYDYVAKGSYLWEPDKVYFAVTAEFVEQIMEGRFPRSIVVATGCWSLKQECLEMAEAFVNKGAGAYVGWTDKVGIDHSDASTLELLRHVFADNKTIAGAVSQCNSVVPTEGFNGSLAFYPSDVADWRLNEFAGNNAVSHFLLLGDSAGRRRRKTCVQKVPSRSLRLLATMV